MKICILSGNPKDGGLCRSVTDAVRQGIVEGGAVVDEISLNNLNLTACRVCGNGWGKCASEHRCEYGSDGFDEAKTKIENCDALVIVTPVYWGEVSEVLKSFLDRLRRCEFRTGALKDKQVLIIASAGGTGNGILTCLEQMDRFCRHTGAVIFDYIGVNRWNSDYKKVAAGAAGYALAKGRRNGETI